MTDPRTDAQLVHDHLGGDPSALAAMFDRFGPGLFDTAAAMTRDRHDAADLVQDVFVMAAERLGQLREPDRLKAWMYAVLRNEVYRRTKKRSRVRPTDFGAPDVPEMAAPLDPQADAEMVAYTELAELVRAAAGGLDERDQLMLELSVRQGLQGADLAAAMGITPEQSYTLVHRMRERVERALGALVVARAGRRDCPELTGILGAWNGEFTILIRKRVARHIDACDTCTRTRAKAAPIALLGAAPAMAMPAGLRERVLGAASAPTTGTAGGSRNGYSFDAPGGFPGLVRTGTRAAAWLVGAAAVLILALGGAVLWQSTRAAEPALVTATTAAAIETIATTTQPEPATTSAAPPTDPTTGPTTSAPRGTTTTVAPTSTTTVAPATTATPVPSPTTAPVVVTPTTPTTPTTAPAPTTTRPPRTTTSTSTTVAPGRLTLSTNVVDLGAGSTGVVTVTNAGGAPVEWSITGSPDPFSLSASPGTLAPGAQTNITITFLRDAVAEGNYAATVTIRGGGSASLTIRAKVNRAPQVDITDVDNCIAPRVFAVVVDESPVTVALGWNGPENGTTTMSLRNGVWTAAAPVQTAGIYTFTVQATDSVGSTASDTTTATVATCPG
jgi:RNA polymerase sigma factor (sigma-70 family)